MHPPRILHIGYDDTLIAMRTHVLSSAGYTVEESDSLNRAIYLLESDLIDAVLICHTVPRSDQQLLVMAAKAKRRLLPVLFLRVYANERSTEDRIVVDNDPVALLNAVRLATNRGIAESVGGPPFPAFS
jgi:CheY-like chemotaxis protein